MGGPGAPSPTQIQLCTPIPYFAAGATLHITHSHLFFINKKYRDAPTFRSTLRMWRDCPQILSVVHATTPSTINSPARAPPRSCCRGGGTGLFRSLLTLCSTIWTRSYPMSTPTVVSCHATIFLKIKINEIKNNGRSYPMRGIQGRSTLLSDMVLWRST